MSSWGGSGSFSKSSAKAGNTEVILQSKQGLPHVRFDQKIRVGLQLLKLSGRVKLFHVAEHADAVEHALRIRVPPGFEVKLKQIERV